MTSRCAILALAAALLAAAPAAAHPKPGAHADIRIAVYDQQVRVELLMNLMFVDGLIASRRQAPDDITPAELDSLTRGLRAYFGITSAGTELLLDRPNRVTIDALQVTPVEVECTIIRPQPETRPGFEQNPLLLIPQVHLILEFPCKRPPRAFSIAWGTFPLDFLAQDRPGGIPPPVEIEAHLVAEGAVQIITLTKLEPEFTWHGAGTLASERMAVVPQVEPARGRILPVLPILIGVTWLGAAAWSGRRYGRRGGLATLAALPVAAALAWAGAETWQVTLEPGEAVARRPADDDATKIFAALHTNIYRAFDYAAEPEIYDALARSVDGPLLDSMYNEVYRSLIMAEEGGAVCRVKTVTPLETVIEPDASGVPRAAAADSDWSDPTAASPPEKGSFSILARWRLEGVVYHWGHSHTRLNEYQARYRIAPRQEGWRIVSSRTLEQFRLDPLTAVPIPGDAAAPPAGAATGGEKPFHPAR